MNLLDIAHGGIFRPRRKFNRRDEMLFTVFGGTGKVGSAVARVLLSTGHRVRVPTREPGGAKLVEGAEAFRFDLDEESDAAFAAAFDDADGAFLMLPPGFAERDPAGAARRRSERFGRAVEQTGLSRVVALSSIGADRSGGVGAIEDCRSLEEALSALPATILRGGYFFENWTGALSGAVSSGVLATPLQDLTRRIPSVATSDIGRVAAEILTGDERPDGPIEIAGPVDLSPNDVAALLAEALGRTIVARSLVRDEAIAAMLAAGGSPSSAERLVAMAEAIDAGRVVPTRPLVRGATRLDQVLPRLVDLHQA